MKSIAEMCKSKLSILCGLKFARLGAWEFEDYQEYSPSQSVDASVPEELKPLEAAHDHVSIAVEGASTSGVELVPAQRLEDGNWLLLRSPLYAMQLAAGDTIRVANSEAGTFSIVARGGNVAVQFYLPEIESDDLEATAKVANKITPAIVRLGGGLDGQTAGLIVYTIPVDAGFSAIEDVFAAAVSEFPGSQWQYANVYETTTGKPLRWWE